MPIFKRGEPSRIAGHGIIPRSPLPTEINKKDTDDHVSHRPLTPRVSGREVFATPSISGALNELSSVQDKGADSPHPATGGFSGTSRRVQPFSGEDLIRAWEKFVGKIEAPQLKSALSTREPALSARMNLPDGKEEWIIGYELDNELQMQRLTLDLKPKLLSYLRRHLNNDAIDIKFSVIPHTDTGSAVPYTDSEKWQVLVEKNPSLAYLKSKFGLDFE